MCETLFQTLQMNKTDIYFIAMNIGQIIAVIQTWKLNIPSIATQLMKVKFRTVETTKIVNNRHIKFLWIIGFEEKTLVTFYRKRSGMPFRKRITSKTFHLSPDFCCNRFFISKATTV